MSVDKAPYSKRGLMHYPQAWFGETIEWRPNEPFSATIRFTDYGRGRSAAYFNWQDENGQMYPMFISDLADLLTKRSVVDGEAVGLWIVRKRGQNYGLAMHDER